MHEPYIGITDFACGEEVNQMLAVFLEHRRAGSNRKLHVGVMASYKTLGGHASRWSGIYPPVSELPKIFSNSSPEIFNCLHYADYDNTIHEDNFLVHGGLLRMVSAISECPHLHGIQLDMVWPDPGVLWAMHTSMPGELILQIGSRALAVAENDPDRVAHRASSYKGLVDRFLFDKSGGRGIGLNAQVLLPFMRRVREEMPELTDAQFVVAGGLGPNSLHLLEPILEEFPGVSTDAQSRLRPSGDAMYPIDWSMGRDYLVKSLKLQEGRNG